MTGPSPDPVADVQAAERRAALAKERLAESAHRLQAKLNPKTLAREAARSATDKGRTYARAGVDAARQNPAPVAGAVAATGLFLLRHRIAGLFRRKQKLTVPAQARAPDPTYTIQGDSI
ncbi:phosphatase [Sphingomonas sp.]|uniref:phosphatase n=1 Tax=Sphingomonas sp. TaxID=28214 RepID=UPI002D7F8C27|nr:phosphatase [Sphingomonas sp.]HEU0045136.1 phosphatase [Sphingomonas sp.]